MDSLSAVEMARMRALAYLSVTAVMEKYMGSGAIKLDPIASNGSGHSTGKNWTKNLNLNMLIKKVKNEGKAAKEAEENTVFGQPLDVIYKRTGHCLPRTILEVRKGTGSTGLEASTDLWILCIVKIRFRASNLKTNARVRRVP